MKFNRHDKLEGKHALLSPSKFYWLNYDRQRLEDFYRKQLAVQKGTELHALAAGLISNNIRQSRSKKTFNLYVNDAIGYRMTPEQSLYYSDLCFGTSDAISFSDGLLRIHDLKTGATPAHIEQLLIYAALFCLEYHMRPSEIDIDLRIYQSDEALCHKPDDGEIEATMDKIVEADKVISDLAAKEA